MQRQSHYFRMGSARYQGREEYKSPTQEIARDIDRCGVVEAVIRHPNVSRRITIAYRYQLRTGRQANVDAVPI